MAVASPRCVFKASISLRSVAISPVSMSISCCMSFCRFALSRICCSKFSNMLCNSPSLSAISSMLPFLSANRRVSSSTRHCSFVSSPPALLARSMAAKQLRRRSSLPSIWSFNRSISFCVSSCLSSHASFSYHTTRGTTTAWCWGREAEMSKRVHVCAAYAGVHALTWRVRLAAARCALYSANSALMSFACDETGRDDTGHCKTWGRVAGQK